MTYTKPAANDNNPHHILVDLCSPFGKPQLDIKGELSVKQLFDDKGELWGLWVE